MQDLDAFYTWFVEPSLTHFKRIGAFYKKVRGFGPIDLNPRIGKGRRTLQGGWTILSIPK